MSQDRTCKRCSVTRVNALVEVYTQAHQNGGGRQLSQLKQVSSLAVQRGFSQGRGLLTPGLADKDLRALCWNVSSFIQDEEAGRIMGRKFQ